MAPKQTKASGATKGKGKTKKPASKAKRTKPSGRKAPRAPRVQKATGPKPKTLKQNQKAVRLIEAQVRTIRVTQDDDLPAWGKNSEADPNFVQGSEANLTWGCVNTVGALAGHKARNGRSLGDVKARLRMSGGAMPAKKSRVGADGLAGGIVIDSDVDSDAEDWLSPEEAKRAREEAERVRKLGGRSRLLELPKEIREIIYGFLLIKDKPVIVHCNWTAVYRVAATHFDHNILKVNSLINYEANKLLYTHNVFHARVQSVMPHWRHHDFIAEGYVGYFRDVVVEVPKNRTVIDMQRENLLHGTLLALRSADCHLQTLTLVLAPYYLVNLFAPFAIAPDASTVAYADWFRPGADVHRVLTKGLRCRELFVVVKLIVAGIEGRVVIRVETACLPQNFRREMIIDGWEVVKERVVGNAERARAEVERVRGDLEWLVEEAARVGGWDELRVGVVEYERERREEAGGGEELPRLRIMEEDEEVQGLKWWSSEQKRIKKEAAERKVMEVAGLLQRTSIASANASDGVENSAAQEDTAHVEEMEHDVQSTSPLINHALATAPDIPAAPPGPYIFIPRPGESNMMAGMRARRERLLHNAGAIVGDLRGEVSAAAMMAGPREITAAPPEPSSLLAMLGTLRGVRGEGVGGGNGVVGPFAALVAAGGGGGVWKGGDGEGDGELKISHGERDAGDGEGHAEEGEEAMFFPDTFVAPDDIVVVDEVADEDGENEDEDGDIDDEEEDQEEALDFLKREMEAVFEEGGGVGDGDIDEDDLFGEGEEEDEL